MNARLYAILIALLLVLPGAWGQQVNKTAEMLPQATFAQPQDIFLVTTGMVGTARSTRSITSSNLWESLAAGSNFNSHVPIQAVAPTNGISTMTNGQLIIVGANLSAGQNVSLSTNGLVITISSFGNSATNATFWLTTNGFLNVSLTNGTLLASISNNQVSINTNLLISGTQTNLSPIYAPNFTTPTNTATSGYVMVATTSGGTPALAWQPQSAVGGTNATFWLTTNGFFNVYSTNGTLLLAVSNNLVSINTNTVINGMLTINSTTNTDWIVNLVTTGWMAVSNSLTIGTNLQTGQTVFDAQGNMTHYQTNQLWQAQDNGSNVFFQVTGSNDTATVFGLLNSKTNNASYPTLTNPVVSGVNWTNSTGARAQLFLDYTLTDSSVSGDPGLCMTNTTTGEWFNATNSITTISVVLSGRASFLLAPNDVLIVTNKSSGSASASLDASWAKLQ